MRTPIFLAAILGAFALGMPGHAQDTSTIPVETFVATLKPVTSSAEFVGRVEAVQRVDIRARVTGFLQKILFKEGEIVEQGQTLYEIESDTFQAAVLEARGALFHAQGAYANASAQRARAEELVRTNATSRAELDRQVASEQAAQGDVITADANLKTAVINLDYTKIVSPITGEIGRTKLTIGNVVGPDSGVLTTIVSRDPMYVTFPVSQREFLKVKSAEEKRQRQEQLGVRITFSDGSVYGETGKINFIDVSVDRATDTVIVRATMPNPHASLVDGQLVRVNVLSDKPEEKVVVPQSALIADQQGIYVFVVANGKAAVQRVKVGGEVGPLIIVNEGLKGGEQVVVQGMESLRPGALVVATPAPVSTDRG